MRACTTRDTCNDSALDCGCAHSGTHTRTHTCARACTHNCNTQGEPVSLFEKEIAWLHDRGQRVPTLAAAASSSNNNGSSSKKKGAPLATRRVPRKRVDVVTALLMLLGSGGGLGRSDELAQAVCRCIGLVASLAATSRAPPPRKFGDPHRASNANKDKASIVAARVLLLTPMRGGSMHALKALFEDQVGRLVLMVCVCVCVCVVAWILKWFFSTDVCCLRLYFRLFLPATAMTAWTVVRRVRHHVLFNLACLCRGNARYCVVEQQQQ